MSWASLCSSGGWLFYVQGNLRLREVPPRLVYESAEIGLLCYVPWEPAKIQTVFGERWLSRPS